MFRYIPFEEIDKNKWNGTVHYALNSNVQGYHWYLKSVIGEWGAIIENDYETAVPVLLSPLKSYQYDLLKELGPYSVNIMTKNRYEEILELLDKHNKSSSYPANSVLNSSFLEQRKITTYQKAIFHGGIKYEKLSDSFGDDFLKDLYGDGFEKTKVMSGKKPEEVVALLNISETHKNALMRIMYNAIHRGVGFSNGIEDKETGKVLAMSFFIGTPFSIHELTSYTSGNKKYRQLIFDLLLRNNAERPIKMETFEKVTEMQEIGFDIETVPQVHFSQTTLMKIKKALGGAY